MSIENIIISGIAVPVLWLGAFAMYMGWNKGVARQGRGQQFRRYLLGALCAMIPAAVTSLNLLQPAVGMALLVAVAWMVTYPLLYHLTNKEAATEYDNQIDIAVGIYLFGWLTGILAVVPSAEKVIWIVELLLFAVPLTQWVYYFVCKGCLDVNGMKMLQETHYNEIIEFLRSYHPLKVAGVAFAVIVLCGVFVTVNVVFGFDSIGNGLLYGDDGGFNAGLYGWIATAIAAGMTVFMTVYLFKQHHGLMVRTGVFNLYNVVKDYVRSNSSYAADTEQRLSRLSVTPLGEPYGKPSTVVMVIGESASRDYMSAFSETDKDTTPWMKAMTADEQHCVAFPNAYSCDIQTVPSLERALTEYNQYDGGQFHTSCSIVDIAHKMGWRVHWYSNQGHLGAADTPTTLVADTADVAKWTHQELNKIQYDENLIGFLDEIDSNQNNLVVLHLKGSHFNFENRFPAKERLWGKAGDDDDITNYENSIRYTDGVLSRFFDYCRSRLNMQAMVYFSDHGCVPDRHRLPNFGGFGDTRIPLWIWMSDEYAEKHPKRATSLKANRDAYWTNDLAYELMCGVMDIESDNFRECNSLASATYKHTRNTLTTMSGQVKIAEDKYNHIKEQ